MKISKMLINENIFNFYTKTKRENILNLQFQNFNLLKNYQSALTIIFKVKMKS